LVKKLLQRNMYQAHTSTCGERVIILPYMGQCIWRKLLWESHPEISAAFLGFGWLGRFRIFRSLHGFVFLVLGVCPRVVNIFLSGVVFASSMFETIFLCLLSMGGGVGGARLERNQLLTMKKLLTRVED
jgi:hypothetical protein